MLDLSEIPQGKHASEMVPAKYVEYAIIGCLIRDPKEFGPISSKLTQDHFQNSECNRFYQFFIELAKNNKTWDDIVFLDKFYEYDMKFTNIMMDIGGNLFLNRYIEILQLKLISRQIYKEAQKNSEVDVDLIKALVEEFYKTQAIDDEIDTGAAFDKAVERLNSDKPLIEMPIDYPDLNNRINGLVRGDVVVVAGRPGHSKSMFTLNLLTKPLMDGRKILLADYEMSPLALMQRLTCLMNNIPLNWITKRMTSRGRPAPLNDVQKKMAIAALDSTKKMFKDQILIVKQQSFESIEAKINVFKPDVLVIDTLQVFAQDQKKEKGMFDSQHLSKLCRKMRLLAERANINIIQCSQLNIRTDDVIPNKGHMKESGGIEENAATILCVRNREKAYPGNDLEIARYDVAIRKNRHGEEVERILYNNIKTGRISEGSKIPSAEEEDVLL